MLSPYSIINLTSQHQLIFEQPSFDRMGRAAAHQAGAYFEV